VNSPADDAERECERRKGTIGTRKRFNTILFAGPEGVVIVKLLRIIPLALIAILMFRVPTNADGGSMPREVSVHNDCDSPDGGNDYTQPCDFVVESHPSDKETEWTIDLPDVVQPQTAYPEIKFKPDDIITIQAGGCVQSGGSGNTWHTYVNPSGGDAETYYSGTIWIPGFIPQDAGDVTGFPRIQSYLGQPLRMEGGLAKTGRLAGINPNDIFLRLGFEDEQGDYGDNGYWGHDNGPNNQCLGVGGAWVTILVKSTKARTVGWSQTQSKPFDVVWRMDNDYDGNWVPLNPFWAAQVGSKVGAISQPQPDFKSDCGAAFNGNFMSDGGTIYSNILAQKCTRQAPADDLYSGVTWFGAHCAWNPVGGHVNWTLATYSGTIFWNEWSGTWPNDDDINLNLLTDHNAGITTQEGGLLGLEFDRGETLDNYTAPFWSAVDNDAPLSTGFGQAFTSSGIDALNTMFDGKPAVVTGVLGIDGVHNGYAEIHPVLALAVLNDKEPAGDGVDETWEFFIRNSGDEGSCSSGNEHWWSGLSDVTGGGNAWYFINLPVSKDTADFQVKNFTAQASQDGIVGPAVVKGAGWNYVGFEMPSTTEAFVDGELIVHYKTKSPKDLRRLDQHVAHRTGHTEEGGDWGDAIARIKDTATRKKFTAFFTANAPVLFTPMPDRFHTRAGGEEDALRAIAAIKPEDLDRLRHDHPKVDLARKKAIDDFNNKLKAFMDPLHLTPDFMVRNP